MAQATLAVPSARDLTYWICATPDGDVYEEGLIEADPENWAIRSYGLAGFSDQPQDSSQEVYDFEPVPPLDDIKKWTEAAKAESKRLLREKGEVRSHFGSSLMPPTVVCGVILVARRPSAVFHVCFAVHCFLLLRFSKWCIVTRVTPEQEDTAGLCAEVSLLRRPTASGTFVLPRPMWAERARW